MPALDQNLFTLKIKRSEGEPGALDLIDPQGNLAYRKRVVPAAHQQQQQSTGEAANPGLPMYDLWDPLSDSLLSTLSAAPATVTKKKTITLYNPTVNVDLSFTGSINFRWQFTWEDHTYEFKKEECFMLRRPDPPVLVAVYEFSRKQTRSEVGSVQLLDYNLTRFDIDDRKGLEVVMLTGLLSFQEAITGQPDPTSGAFAAATGNSEPSPTSMLSRVTSLGTNDPPPPALPPKDVGLQVSGLQIREKSPKNEVLVTAQFEIDEYAEYACKLLNDSQMLYIVVRSKTAAEVPKVVAIASLVKRMRYKGGAYDEELHQYAKYEEEEEQKKGPRVIKLDEPPASKDPAKSYRPPTALSIHLSKIAMPELQPRARPGHSTVSSSHSKPPSSSLNVPESSGARRGRSPSPAPYEPSGSSSSSGGGGGRLTKPHKAQKSRPESTSFSSAGYTTTPPHGATGALSAQQPLYPGGFAKSHKNAPSSGSSRPHSQPPRLQSQVQQAQGPASPRTSFWGFYNPGTVNPGSQQQQQQQQHSGSAGQPSPQSPSSAMPGSYFPPSSRPPPPPSPPVQQQQQSGGFSSLLGGILPHSGQSGSAGAPQSVSDTARVVGHMGMQMFEKYTKR